jgi:hypothetical protein
MNTIITLTSFPLERKVAVIKAIRKPAGLDLLGAKDLIEALPATIEFPTVDAAKEAMQALEHIGAIFTCDEAAVTAAHEVWVILDESDNKLRIAKSLLTTLRIALRNPELSLSNDDAAESLVLLGGFLDILGDNIDIARDRVKGLDTTAPQEAA